MKKIIVFDVDRTLVDSFEPELLSLKEAIENVLQKEVSKDVLLRLTTMPTTEFFDSLNLEKEILDQIQKEWSKVYDNYKIDCFPNIKEVIKKLHKNGYKIGILTSRTMSEYHELDNILKDIESCIDIIVTSDLVNKAKPNKESMDYLMKELNCTNKDIIYIGDSSIDEEFAHNANTSFIPAVWENKELENRENACFSPLELLEKIKD